MNKCLVTGGLGFIGSHVVDALIDEGHEVIIVDDLSTGKIENWNESASYHIRNIKERSFFRQLEKVDYVFHLAALARIQPSIDNPAVSHDVNLTGTLNVLEYARKHKAKVIFSSSSSIYEGESLPTSESAIVDPKNPYALQKMMCEQYIRLYKELYDLDYTILRYFNVYGERQILDGAYAAVVGIFLDQYNKNQPLTITGDGEQRRDFTYVKDVARANVMAMLWRGTYNIGSGKNYSINDLAEMIGGEKEYIDKRAGEAQATLADSSKAKAIGWKPSKDIKDWILENINR